MAISYYLKEYHSAKLNKTEIDILKSNKLFELILLEVMQKNKQKHLNPHVEKIKKYIQESVDKNITLEEISKVANLHPVYCGELFKKHEKCSIMSYHENLRMQHAALLLESGEFNVGQTALQLGYEDAAYFSRIFKKNIGVSPSIYQAQVI